MNYKKLQFITGTIVFFATLFVYLLTVQPSVSFWDCGEFIASAFLLQVPHPPGTPLFLLIGRVLSILPFASDVAFKVNMISVLSSAFTVLFLYLTAVKIIETWKGRTYENFFDALGVHVSAAIGAFSLTFADTFWFNAVEAEVYAFATFFIGLISWLIMLWHEKSEEPDSEKYILMIAYLIGLSTGVHLMAVLSIVSVVMIVMFKKFVTNEEELKKTGYLLLAHAGILLLVALGMWYGQDHSQMMRMSEYKAFDSQFITTMAVISLLFMAIFWKKVFSRNSFYIPLIAGGIVLFLTYPGVVKVLPNMVAKVGGQSTITDLIVFLLILGGLVALTVWAKKENKPNTNIIAKSFLLILVGFTTYGMIIIRSNQDTPINLNSPKTFPELVSYLNREQYGDNPVFKRRYTHEGHQQIVYDSYNSDLDFLVRYQMNHMFNRYLLWNYAGRESTAQDAGVDYLELLMIPFIIGLFGIYYHFKKDWKMASAFLVMFIFLGYLTAFYQNQQQPQPRERDYFYTGAFFVYSLWVALGVRGIFELIQQGLKEKAKGLQTAWLAVAIVAVPGLMMFQNYHSHDRSNNYVPWDYAYNLLQSVAPNAILFTNGDNDTFPLWYLQDVAGVRQDVRIANLSLMNTEWYNKQLKNYEPHGAPKIKMSYTDEQLDRLSPRAWEPKQVSIDVPQNVIAEHNVTDSALISTGKITWMFESPASFPGGMRVQDLTALDIVQNNVWDRPVYFAITTANDAQLGLQDYMIMEGFAMRIVPKKSNRFFYVDEEIMREQLFNEPEGFSKDYQPGFKFRGLTDSSVFLDNNHMRLARNYRNSFIHLALHYLYEEKDNVKVVETLDQMETKLPRDYIDMDYGLKNYLATIYMQAGAYDRYEEIAREVEKEALAMIERDPLDFRSQENPYRILLDIYETLEEYDKALGIILQIQKYVPDDPSVQRKADEYRRLMGRQDGTEIEQPLTAPDTSN